MIISDFINKMIKKYNIDIENNPNFKNNFKMKIFREINNDNDLSEIYQNTNEVKIAKTTAKDFDEEFLNKLEKKLKRYILKFNNLDENDYSESEFLINIKKNRPNDYNFIFENTTPSTKSKNLMKLNHRDKIDLMIETLFYEKYELDESLYAADLSIIRMFNESNDIEDINISENDDNSIIQSLTRIRNPRKYYIKKK
jgi:hypothetical protein